MKDKTNVHKHEPNKNINLFILKHWIKWKIMIFPIMLKD